MTVAEPIPNIPLGSWVRDKLRTDMGLPDIGLTYAFLPAGDNWIYGIAFSYGQHDSAPKSRLEVIKLAEPPV